MNTGNSLTINEGKYIIRHVGELMGFLLVKKKMCNITYVWVLSTKYKLIYTLSCTAAYISLIDRPKRQKRKYTCMHVLIQSWKTKKWIIPLFKSCNKNQKIKHFPAAFKKDLSSPKIWKFT